MSGLLEGIIDPQYVGVVSWIIIAAVGLVLLYAAYRILRLLTSGTFISGGRNRRTRLAIMDATAVDEKRRLVLVRRDDVEHLILIGGPTDVVVEQDIRMIPKSARSSPTEQQLASEPAEPVVEPSRTAVAAPVRPAYRESRPAERQASSRPSIDRESASGSRAAPSAVNTQPSPAAASQPQKPAIQPTASHGGPAPAAAPAVPRSAPGPQVSSASAPAPAARTEPARTGFYSSFQNRAGQPTPAPTRVPVPPPAAAAPAAKPVSSPPMSAPAASDLDDALLHELEASLEVSSKDQTRGVDKTLDDEMSKLFGELSRDRKQVN